MQRFAVSLYHKAVCTDNPPAPPFFSSSAKLQSSCSRCVPSLHVRFRLLHNNVPQAILFEAMHEKRDAVHAPADLVVISDAGAQQGPAGGGRESGPERGQ